MDASVSEEVVRAGDEELVAEGGFEGARGHYTSGEEGDGGGTGTAAALVSQ